MANTSGEKELKTNWPVEEGLTAGTTKLHSEWVLEAEDSKVLQKDREGI